MEQKQGIPYFYRSEQLLYAMRYRVCHQINAGVVTLGESLWLIVAERPHQSQTVYELKRRRKVTGRISVGGRRIGCRELERGLSVLAPSKFMLVAPIHSYVRKGCRCGKNKLSGGRVPAVLACYHNQISFLTVLFVLPGSLLSATRYRIDFLRINAGSIKPG